MKRFGLGILLILAAGAGRSAEGPPPPPDPCSPSPDACAYLATDPGGPPAGPRVWGDVDYLLWWARKGRVPPLVSTGPPTDPFPGALDQPNTRVLFGGHGLDYGAFNGLRLDVGAWLDDDRRLGVEAGGFAFERRSAGFAARGDANGQPYLAAPFTSALSGNQNVYFISQNFANPDLSALLSGGVVVSSGMRLWGWEVNGLANVGRGDAWSLDLLGGFRQVSLREDLGYAVTSGNLADGGAVEFETTPVAPGFTVSSTDLFRTENLFDGAQVGARVRRRWGVLSAELVGKLAFGAMHEGVRIDGETTTNAPLPVTQAAGGIYAQTSNGGSRSRDVFAVVPEADVNLCLNLTPNLRARVGYTFLYLSSVVRPGDQVDTTINTNRVPIDPFFGTPGGPNRPAPEMRATGFWAQGINFGLELRF